MDSKMDVVLLWYGCRVFKAINHEEKQDSTSTLFEELLAL
jgi:hypothetical protein